MERTLPIWKGLLLLGLALQLASGCQSPSDTPLFAQGGSGDDGSPTGSDPDDSSDTQQSDFECDDLLRLSGLEVSGEIEESEDLGAQHGCVSPWCGEEYFEFADRAEQWIRPIDASELSDQILSLDSQSFLNGPMDDAVLAAEIIEALRICFLFESLEDRPLEVSIVEDHEESDETWIQWILVTDPLVGTFRMMILTPKEADEPLPAIVAVHGHGTEAGDFVYAYHGLAYAEAGYALVAVDMRANGADDLEREVGWNLLLNGFTLQGLHNYELLQAHRYLRWRDDILSDRIGLIGHSAGAMKGNSLVRVTDAFAAYVTDNESEYTSTFDPGNPGIEEDTIPNLYPYTNLINDFEEAPLPVLHVEYGFPEGPGPILDFFDEHLND